MLEVAPDILNRENSDEDSTVEAVMNDGEIVDIQDEPIGARALDAFAPEDETNDSPNQRDHSEPDDNIEERRSRSSSSEFDTADEESSTVETATTPQIPTTPTEESIQISEEGPSNTPVYIDIQPTNK